MATISTSEAIQLGKAEFARICGGKAPNVDAVLSLGAYLFAHLNVPMAPVRHSAEKVVEVVRQILQDARDLPGVPAESRDVVVCLVGEYETVVAPALLAALSVAEVNASSAAVMSALAGLNVPVWKRILQAVCGCLGMAGASVAMHPHAAAGADTEPAAEELAQDMRLVVDAKAPPAQLCGPTPPPTPATAPPSPHAA